MNIVDCLEAVLFACREPASVSDLALSLGLTEGQVAQALEILEARLEEKGGIQLTFIAGGYQLCSKPEHAEAIRRHLHPKDDVLGKSILEVLAVVAYRQPVTLSEIEAIRGVQSDYGLRKLLDKKLIEEVGKKQVPGRPSLYGTTQQFLHSFNLNSLNELPPIEAGDRAKALLASDYRLDS